MPVPPANSFGGPTSQSFVYDDLYRLTKAAGTYDFAPNKRDRYSLNLAYDTIHNITGKAQHHEIVVPGGQAITQKKTSYDWSYEYASTHPHAVTHLGERSYRYDANGNQTGWDHDRNGTRRNIVWDDENRIQSLFDNGHEKAYKYDDEGNRVIKRGPQGETVYVNQWFTVRNREVASKHVWAGTTRIATALVPGVKPGVKPAGSGMGKTAPSTGTPTGTQPRGILQATGLQQRSAVAAQRARNLEKNPHYATGVPGTPPGTATNQDNFLYFYHPDHLGSSSYVTDANGKPYEHLEYFPFGETWVQESSNTQRTPYLFTGKELDEETGLYYYGARYYDPRTSVWQSPDPILAKYLSGAAGGLEQPINFSLYTYGRNNPIAYKDPDGNIVFLAIPLLVKGAGAAFALYGAYQTGHAIGTNAYQVYTGEKAASQALKEGAIEVGTNAALSATGLGVVKVVNKVVPDQVQKQAINNIKSFVSGQGSKPTVRYNRKKHYGGAQTDSPAAQRIRAEAEGQPCPKCGNEMISGTDTAPSPQHSPSLFEHYTKHGGHAMTDAERKAYARSEEAFDGANCLTCQRSEGGELAQQARKYNEENGL